MTQKQKEFKTEWRAHKFAQKLKANGKFDIQIWEMPSNNGKKNYVVIWNEN